MKEDLRIDAASLLQGVRQDGQVGPVLILIDLLH